MDKFQTNFHDYVEHLVLSWYLRNAKIEGLTISLPHNTVSLIADFAQNIEVVKKWETAEEYFHRPEIAMHGIVSGFKLDNGDLYQMCHITTSDYRLIVLLLLRCIVIHLVLLQEERL